MRLFLRKSRTRSRPPGYRYAETALGRVSALAAHPVSRNTAALFAVQSARYLVPLALVPFLARVLRPDAFGQLAFAQALGFTLSVLADFGFSLSATRDIARHRSQPESLPEIAATILGAKLLLAAAVCALGAVLLAVVPQFHGHAAFLWGACIFAVAMQASPVWFFQGVESMAVQSAIDLAGNAAAAAAIFVLIRRPDQAVWVLFLMAAGALAGALVNHLRMYRRIRFLPPRAFAGLHMMHREMALFVILATARLYTSLNVFLLGLLVPDAVVAVFAGAEKIVRAAVGLFYPVNQALFPHLSHLMQQNRRRGIHTAVWAVAITLAVAVLGCVLLYALAPLIVHVVLGKGYDAAIPLLRGFTALIVLLALSNALGSQILLPLGMDRAAVAAPLGAVAISLGLIFLLVPRFGALGMVWAEVASEAFVTAVVVFIVWHSGALQAGGANQAGAVGSQ